MQQDQSLEPKHLENFIEWVYHIKQQADHYSLERDKPLQSIDSDNEAKAILDNLDCRVKIEAAATLIALIFGTGEWADGAQVKSLEAIFSKTYGFGEPLFKQIRIAIWS